MGSAPREAATRPPPRLTAACAAAPQVVLETSGPEHNRLVEAAMRQLYPDADEILLSAGPWSAADRGWTAQ